MAKTKVSCWVIFPVAKGLPLVLAIRESIFSSIKQLKAAAAPETKPIPKIEAIKISIGTIAGVDKNMPITAVNTIKALTLGLQRVIKFFSPVAE